jgi:hypothetical protein
MEIYFMNLVLLAGSNSFPEMCKWNAFTIDTEMSRLQGWLSSIGKNLPLSWGKQQ